MTKQKKILIIGSFCNISGYSDHARLIADAFIQHPGNHTLHLIDLQWAEATRTPEYSEKYLPYIQHTQEYLKFLKSTNTSMAAGFDCCFQVRPPNEWHRVTNYDIGVTAALETVAAPEEWIPNCNMMQQILVVSQHSKKNLLNAVHSQSKEKIRTPIEVVPFYNNLPLEREKFSGYEGLSTNKNFLCVSQFAPRKNLFRMMHLFLDEFGDDEDVGLVLKTYMRNNSHIDYYNISAMLKKFVNDIKPNKKCKIHLIHGSLTQNEMASLYDAEVIDAYISLTHGEGFGIPIFNAVCSDIPVVAPSWSGHMDYLKAPVINPTSGKAKTKNLFLKTGYDLGEVREEHLMPDLITQGAKWCYPNEKQFRKNIRTAITSTSLCKKEAKILGEHIRKEYTQEKINQMYYDVIDAIGEIDAAGETDNAQIFEL